MTHIVHQGEVNNHTEASGHTELTNVPEKGHWQDHCDPHHKESVVTQHGTILVGEGAVVEGEGVSEGGANSKAVYT